jgi:putative ABC transport system permease protein
MRYLDRIILRELAANKSRTFVLVLALAVAFLLPAGIEMGLRSLLQTRSSFADAHGLADLEIRMAPEDLRNLPDWTGIPGLKRVEERLLLPGVIHRTGAQPLNTLMVFLRHTEPTINRLAFREGRGLPEGALAEAVVERSAREFHGIGVGQQLLVTVGNQTYTQQVVGVAASPEFLVVAANPEYFLPEKGSLVVVYTSLERVYENVGFRMVNDLIFTFSPGAEREATKTAILAALGTRQIERLIPRDEHISWRHITLDDNVFRLFQPAIAVVLAVLAAGLVVVNFDRLVRRQRAELGAVKAMGYPGAALVRAYVGASLCLAAAGIVVGTLGAIAFRSAFLWIYADAHGLAYLEHHLYWPVLLRSSATVLLIAVAGALAATWRLWRTSALTLMRPLLAQAGRHRGLRRGRLPEGWPMPIRLAVRNVARAPRLTALTVVGVASTVAVAAAYLICVDSMSQAVLRSVDSQRWSSAVSFLHPVLDEDYQGSVVTSPGVRVEGFVRSQAMLENASNRIAVSMLGVIPSGSLHAVNLVSGRMAQTDDEIVLGADLARRFGVSTGSELDLTIRNDRRRVAVVGVKSDVVLSEAIMSLPALQRLLEMEEQATGMFVAAPDATVATAIADRLRELDFVGRVTGRTALVEEFTAFLEDIRQIVLLVAGIALLVAVVFIAANLSMAVAEQATEFSTLWSLGFNRASAMRIVLVNGLVQTALGLLLAVPLTAALAALLNALASRAWFDQATYVSPLIPLLVVGSVVVLTIVGTHVTFGRFWRSDLLDNLRARSIQ